MLKQKQATNKRQIGSEYEQMAKKYLVSKGYEILYTNYRCKLGEIDIIAKDESHIIFIEVKYRSNSFFGYPREAVDYKKQKRIRKVAQYFIKTELRQETSCRFDIIEILDTSLTHIVAAF